MLHLLGCNETLSMREDSALHSQIPQKVRGQLASLRDVLSKLSHCRSVINLSHQELKRKQL